MASTIPRLSSISAGLAALFLLGCSAEKRAYRQAAELHGRSIAYISAMRPFLLSADSIPKSASARHGALLARSEIVRHAIASSELFQQGARPAERPHERIAQAFGSVVPRCRIIEADDVLAEQRRARECASELALLDRQLAAEDERAAQAGLPPGTIPRVGPTSVTKEAERAARDLTALLQPSPGEQLRRWLWTRSEVSEVALRQACERAIDEARAKPPGFLEDISQACSALAVLEKLLQQSLSCRVGQGSACDGPSLCSLLRHESRREGIPSIYVGKLEEAALRCDKYRVEVAESNLVKQQKARHQGRER